MTSTQWDSACKEPNWDTQQVQCGSLVLKLKGLQHTWHPCRWNVCERTLQVKVTANEAAVQDKGTRAYLCVLTKGLEKQDLRLIEGPTSNLQTLYEDVKLYHSIPMNSL
jgi:hypothetical protein